MGGESEFLKKRVKNGWSQSKLMETKIFFGHLKTPKRDYNGDRRVKGNEQ